MIIKKRDGSTQLFQEQKIIDAVILSGASDGIAEGIAEYVEEHIFEGISIFEIEKLVEESLIRLEQTEAAREYISYRAKRASEREMQSALFQDIRGIINKTNEAVLKEKFLIRAVEVHGEKYNYHKVLYKNALEAVEII